MKQTTHNTQERNREMTRKLTCTITRNWSYCGEDRYQALVAKFGSEEQLLANYQSRAGKKLVAEAEGDITKAQATSQANSGDKVACIVTGDLMYISKERMTKKAAKAGTDEAGIRSTYVSRVASRLRKQLAGEKLFTDLTVDEQNAIDAQISQMHEDGTLPKPSAPKGSGETVVVKAPKKVKAPKEPKPDTTVLDVIPTTSELDPLRQIDGEDTKARKNRIARERRALNVA